MIKEYYKENFHFKFVKLLISNFTSQVARCTKIIPPENDQEEAKHMINVRQIAKFVVGLHENVAPTDIEEGMRVGYDHFIINLFSIELIELNIKFDFHYHQKLTQLLQ